MTTKTRILFAIAFSGLVILPAATASAVTFEYTHKDELPGGSVYHYVLKVAQAEWGSLVEGETTVTLSGLTGIVGASDPVNFSLVEWDSTHVTWVYDYAAPDPPSDFQWPYVFVCFAIYTAPPFCEGDVNWEVIWEKGGGTAVGTTFGPRPCVQLGSLGDRVWEDSDADGIQDDGEAGLEGVRILLKDQDGNVLASTITGTNGIYTFADLTPGQYTVCVDQTTLPAGYVQTYDLVPPLDHCASVTLASGENRTDVDFGYYKPRPAISLTKCADKTTICCGEMVTYTYVVQNTGDIALVDVTVVDDAGTPADPSDDFVVGTIDELAIGEEVVLTKAVKLVCQECKKWKTNESIQCYPPPPCTYTTITNTATATGTVGQTGDIVSATAAATVRVKDCPPILPGIKLGKWANCTTVNAGDSVTYAYYVKNTGNVTLVNITITDDAGTPDNPGDDFTVGTIARLLPGRSAVLYKDVTLTCPDCYSTRGDKPHCYKPPVRYCEVTNIAVATGTVEGTSRTVSDSASATVRVVCRAVQPRIELRKRADCSTISSGSHVTYRYTVRNTGDVALRNIRIVDDAGTPRDSSDDFVVGTLSYLAPAQEASFCKRVALECNGDPGWWRDWDISQCYPPRYYYKDVTNTATVTATADLTGQTVSAIALATVRVKCWYWRLPDP